MSRSQTDTVLEGVALALAQGLRRAYNSWGACFVSIDLRSLGPDSFDVTVRHAADGTPLRPGQHRDTVTQTGRLSGLLGTADCRALAANLVERSRSLAQAVALATV